MSLMLNGLGFALPIAVQGSLLCSIAHPSLVRVSESLHYVQCISLSFISQTLYLTHSPTCCLPTPTLPHPTLYHQTPALVGIA